MEHGVSPLLPPAVVFGPASRPWRLSPQGVLVSPEGQELFLREARVTRFLAHLQVRAPGGERRYSLLFHALNTPEPGFRQLRARLRWASPGAAVSSRGNLPALSLSQPLTHGASGEDHGGLGLANSRDR
jgi:hypothetical protein